MSDINESLATSEDAIRETSVAQAAAFRRGDVPPAEEVRPGVLAVALPMPGTALPSSLCYLIDGGDGSLHLVDSGIDSEVNWTLLCKEIDALGHAIEDVATMTITHLHRDHAGLAARLRREAGTIIRMHRADAECWRRNARYMRDAEVSETMTRWGVPSERRDEVRQAATEYISRAPSTKIDVHLDGGELLAFGRRRMRVVHTPGHTSGHVILADVDAGLLFTGDHVLPGINPGVGLGARTPGDDPMGDYFDSLNALVPYDAFEICPAHGYRFRGLAQRRAQIRARHEQRGRQTRAVLVKHPGRSVWSVAAQLPWTGGFDQLTNGSLFSGLRQTEMHIRRQT